MAASPITVATERVQVRTRRIESGTELITRLPRSDGVLCWVRGGEGLVGWGELARFEASGPRRFNQLDSFWRSFVRRMDVRDEVGLYGSGPVAFTSVAFADRPGHSVLVVPRVIVGRREGVTWVTELAAGGAPADRPVREPVRQPGRLRYCDGQLPVTSWRDSVATAVDRLRSGELAKVVLAHDLLARAQRPLDPRFVLRGLAARYPNCWAFAVDGLVGATPELLVSRNGDGVSARVLAGTTWPQDDLPRAELAAQLLASEKNRAEHRYAVQSMVEALRPFCRELSVPDTPDVLNLRNVLHLATDVHGRLTGAHSVLRLAWLAHPSAAVGGTPAPDARRLIDELEGMDRGRYAGPVGWIDGHGDGELGIALRCAQLDGRAARLFAGCGIVADSDPDTEVREAAAKLVPMRDALEGA
ncbi:MAG TPA: isochorismate synthase [Pseudonocardiaceae bacterium]|nr:isochorismate synthase [Pseudonocardiaceae bacterium]